MRTFLISFFALTLLAVVSGCKHGESSSMDSMDMKGDKPMSPSPATMPADMK